MIDLPFRTMSVFPELLPFYLLGATLLRITLGMLFTKFGYVKLVTEREHYIKFFSWIHKKYGYILLIFIGALEFIGGILLIVGLLTQLIALIFAILMSIAIIMKKKNTKILKNDADYYTMLLIISLSLLFLGPGLFAFDYPVM